ncbi:ExbD/TolR family protein [Jannaschia sp. 2305UL9-9]|uniref:ExbD/TolR family protein n=1 Tax=Jannaschia sp. 2305UL9-9 TaxID=3121638 RepID=UPI003528D379
MIRAAEPRARTRDGALPLINIVFLMLIFFLIAGTVAPPLPQDLTLPDLASGKSEPPPNALAILADGQTIANGTPMDAPEFAASRQGEVVRLVPDRAAPAERVLTIARALRAAGTGEVRIVVSRQSAP